MIPIGPVGAGPSGRTEQGWRAGRNRIPGWKAGLGRRASLLAYDGDVKLIGLFLVLFVCWVVIAGLLAFVGAVFHAGVIIPIIAGVIGLALFLSPGIYHRRKRRHHGTTR